MCFQLLLSAAELDLSVLCDPDVYVGYLTVGSCPLLPIAFSTLYAVCAKPNEYLLPQVAGYIRESHSLTSLEYKKPRS